MEANTHAVAVRVPKKVWGQLSRLAKQNNRSRTAEVRIAIIAHLDNQK